jgi:hypothetical protein
MGGGMGNSFEKKFGVKPSDFSTWKDQVVYALDSMAGSGSTRPWSVTHSRPELQNPRGGGKGGGMASSLENALGDMGGSPSPDSINVVSKFKDIADKTLLFIAALTGKDLEAEWTKLREFTPAKTVAEAFMASRNSSPYVRSALLDQVPEAKTYFSVGGNDSNWRAGGEGTMSGAGVTPSAPGGAATTPKYSSDNIGGLGKDMKSRGANLISEGMAELEAAGSDMAAKYAAQSKIKEGRELIELGELLDPATDPNDAARMALDREKFERGNYESDRSFGLQNQQFGLSSELGRANLDFQLKQEIGRIRQAFLTQAMGAAGGLDTPEWAHLDEGLGLPSGGGVTPEQLAAAIPPDPFAGALGGMQ